MFRASVKLDGYYCTPKVGNVLRKPCDSCVFHDKTEDTVARVSFRVPVDRCCGEVMTRNFKIEMLCQLCHKPGLDIAVLHSRSYQRYN